MESSINGAWRGRRREWLGALAAGLVLVATGCLTTARPETAATAPTAAETLREHWGIEITSLRLSARGYMVDFRYRVVDADKAAALSDPAAQPHLIDQATGLTLAVPRTPKIGALRQSAQKPEVGRVYFILFGNGAKAVQPGGQVTVVVGNFRAENLDVQ